LQLGNINIRRDWGWAPEYVEAMHLMLQQDRPDDYVIATGKSYALEDFIRITFREAGPELARPYPDGPHPAPADGSLHGPGQPGQGPSGTGLGGPTHMPAVVEMMIGAEMDAARRKHPVPAVPGGE
jgi:GDPmannose 4,6-dehydratase